MQHNSACQKYSYTRFLATLDTARLDLATLDFDRLKIKYPVKPQFASSARPRQQLLGWLAGECSGRLIFNLPDALSVRFFELWQGLVSLVVSMMSTVFPILDRNIISPATVFC